MLVQAAWAAVNSHPHWKEQVEQLRRREIDVLRAAAKGISNKEIGSKLGISERTVQTHLVNIFRKLEAGSRTEAVLRALKEGLLRTQSMDKK